MVLKPYRRNPAKYKGQPYGEWSRNQQAPFIPDMFGARGDGVTNDTIAIQTMFDAMKAEGHPGLITQSHVITEGELSWTQDGSVDEPGPVLFTSGEAKFIAAGINDAPIWSIYNTTPNQFVRGGFIGPLKYEDNTTDVASNRHALYLSGAQDIHFGPIYGAGIKGALLYIPHRATDEAGNPVTVGGIGDYFHVFNCYFEMLENIRGSSYTVRNDGENQLLNGCIFQVIRAVNGKGIWLGATGASNVIYMATGGGCTEVGLNFIHNNGTCYRMLIVSAELDAMREGIRLDGLTGFTFGKIRMNHRRYISPTQNEQIPIGETWPLKGITFGRSVGGSVSDGVMTIVHRLSPEVNSTDKLGTLCDFGDTNTVSNLKIDQTILFDTVFPVTTDQLYVNVDPGAYDLIMRYRNRVILDTTRSEGVSVKYIGNLTNGTYATVASKLIYSVSSAGIDYGNYDYTNGFYTVPYASRYLIMVDLRLAVAVGTRIRLAVFCNRGGALVVIKEYHWFVSNAGIMTYEMSCVEYLRAGDKIWIGADNNSGASVPVNNANPGANNRLQIYPVAYP